MSKNTKRFLVCIVIISIFAFGLYLHFNLNGNPIQKQKLKQEVEEYLRNKYNEDMEVANVDYSFTTDTYFADVVTVSEPKINFRVSKNISGNFVDNYFLSYWDVNVSMDISEYATNIFGENCIGDILFTEGSPIATDNHLISNNVPDFLTIRDEFHAAIFSFVKIEKIFDKESKEKNFNDIYLVAKYIFDKYRFNSVEFEYSDSIKVIISLDDYRNLNEVKEIENLMR